MRFNQGEVQMKLKSLMVLLVLLLVVSTFAATELKFYFPVQVAGPLAIKMDGMVKEFNDNHPDISVEAIYSGNYDQTMQKAVTSSRGGNPPDVALLLAIDIFSLTDMDLVQDLDYFNEKEYTEKFFEGFMENATLNGKVWSLPYQRSTPIFYYNKEHFAEVGLDPENPPETWDELYEAAKLLTVKDANGNTTRWGFEDITDDTWTVQAWILQAGGIYSNEEGTIAYFNTPETTDAVAFRNKLADEGYMPNHRAYGAASQDFVAGACSMMYNSTGSLTFVKNSANFEYGVAPLPGNVVKGVPTGGGNLYIFKDIPEENKQAAWTFIKWLTSPENAAKWSIATGYIPIREDAFDTELLKEYVDGFPYILVAKDQLAVAKREMSFHSNSQIREVLLSYLQEILDNRTSVEDGLNDVQMEAEMILYPYQ